MKKYAKELKPYIKTIKRIKDQDLYDSLNFSVKEGIIDEDTAEAILSRPRRYSRIVDRDDYFQTKYEAYINNLVSR